MESFEFKQNEILKVDLHRMRVWEAWLYLDRNVSFAPKEIKEIVVIHGYHSGTKLLDMVRKEYQNKRVKRKFLSLNQGVTSLILT